MSSRSWMVYSAKLATDPELAAVVTRLMMAMNDISVVNNALYEWDQTVDPKKKSRQNGGKLYFARMQVGHIYQALLTLKKSRKRPP